MGKWYSALYFTMLIICLQWSLVLTKKITSNEYLSIDSNERFKKKTVLLCKQHYLIETCIQNWKIEHKQKWFWTEISFRGLHGVMQMILMGAITDVPVLEFTKLLSG